MEQAPITNSKNIILMPGLTHEEAQLEMAMDTFVTNIIVMKRLTDLTWPDADLTGMANEARFLASRIRKGDLSSLENAMISQTSLMAQAWTELMDRWTAIMSRRPADMPSLVLAKNLMEQCCMVQDRFVKTSMALRKLANQSRRTGASVRARRVGGSL